jgi:hypothetical protein
VRIIKEFYHPDSAWAKFFGEDVRIKSLHHFLRGDGFQKILWQERIDCLRHVSAKFGVSFWDAALQICLTVSWKSKC